MPNSIQSGDYSMGSGTDGTSHKFATFNRWDDERKLNVNRNDNDWNDNWWFAGVRNSLYFSSASAEEFCFCSCPAQPPSILPMSSSCVERAIYFLSRSDFVSHKIISNSKRVFSFRIATATNSSFLSRGKNSAPEIASIMSINTASSLSPTV